MRKRGRGKKRYRVGWAQRAHNGLTFDRLSFEDREESPFWGPAVLEMSNSRGARSRGDSHGPSDSLPSKEVASIILYGRLSRWVYFYMRIVWFY